MRDYLDDKSLRLRRERSDSPASARPFVLAGVLCLVAISMIYLDQQGMISSLRMLLQQTLNPVAVQMTGLRNRADDLVLAPRSEADLRATITALEQEVSQLKAENLRLQQAQIENESLRQQLQIQREQPWRLVGAEVSVRPADAGRQVMLIARGSSDGLRVGMAVIGQDPAGPAALVGVIESVGLHTAEVLLITDVSSRISARVMHDGQAHLGLVQGQWQRGSWVQISQINRSVTMSTGDAVVSAGLTGSLNLQLDLATIPANIPIGTIEQINTSGQTQTAELRPFVNPDQVRYVWVILNQNE